MCWVAIEPAHVTLVDGFDVEVDGAIESLCMPGVLQCRREYDFFGNLGTWSVLATLSVINRVADGVFNLLSLCSSCEVFGHASSRRGHVVLIRSERWNRDPRWAKCGIQTPHLNPE